MELFGCQAGGGSGVVAGGLFGLGGIAFQDVAQDGGVFVVPDAGGIVGMRRTVAMDRMRCGQSGAVISSIAGLPDRR